MVKISKGFEMWKRERTKYQEERVQTLLSTLWLWRPKDFVTAILKNIFQDIFYQGPLKLLRNLGCNDNLTEDQKRSSTYCKKCQEQRFCKNWILLWPHSIEKKNKTHQLKSKLLLLSTNNGCPYCHTDFFKKLTRKMRK